MKTIEPFVESYLLGAGYLMNKKILFVAENCPNFSTYFYRTLPGNPYENLIKGDNSLLRNLCNIVGIDRNLSEFDRLIAFLKEGFLLIDSHKNNKIPIIAHPINIIHDDITFINPENILFLAESNKIIIKQLIDNCAPFPKYISKIMPDFPRAELWHCFPARPVHIVALQRSYNIFQQSDFTD